MITAQFKEHLNTGNLSIKVTGHANAVESGIDPVCAASTILSRQAAQAVENMYKQDWLLKKPRISLQKGDVIITFRARPEYKYMAYNMIQIVAIGYAILESKYPEYVSLIKFGDAVKA